MAPTATLPVSDDLKEKYQKNGFALVPDFLTEAETTELKEEIHRVINQEIEGALKNPVIFSTSNLNHAKDTYFLESSDKIRLFFEDDIFDQNGKLTVDHTKSVNKIGHALHERNEVFKMISTSSKVKEVLKQLGFIQPAICQSMYIFKQPGYGGAVNIHQDSTFLNTNPLGLVGFWFALEDSTLDNGCLWAIPGSHKTHPVTHRFVRNTEEGPLCIFRGNPLQVDESKFESLPVKKGTLVLIHGSVVHKSEKNVSANSRHAYTFHVYEQHNTVYSSENWLQPTHGMSFPVLYNEAK